MLSLISKTYLNFKFEAILFHQSKIIFESITSLLAFIALSAVHSSAQTHIHSAILVIDTSNNASYNQVHWLVRTPYLSIKASNATFIIYIYLHSPTCNCNCSVLFSGCKLLFYFFSFQTRIICTVRNARIVIFVLFLFVFGGRSHFLVYSKKVFDNLFVCWQIFNSSSDEKWVLVVESLVGYSVVFIVFVENVILIVILASRKNIQVNFCHHFIMYHCIILSLYHVNY